ncbi:hypothetical protein Fcan01_25843 [Folsomia candida]|uniref:F-box domain-containing protein n=2 Tax=Folsomia candida TaxID=158441 RepID=A0A226D2T6_FOLCA|nr:hypothetical protein Fcan01_25843 [Folsomia candida]
MATFTGKDDDSETESFLNHDIIGHLSSYLCTKDIKTCRLVSSYWNYGATPVLKTRTSMALLLSPGDYGKKDPFPGGALETWNISGAVEKLKFCPTKATLQIPSNPDNRLAECPDFSIFPQTNNLKSIFVEFPAGDQFRWQHELATKFVQAASTTLQELEFVSIRGNLNKRVALDFPSFEGSVFPKLRKLRVDIHHKEGAVPRILQAVTTSFPNLERLATQCKQFVEILEAGLILNWPK